MSLEEFFAAAERIKAEQYFEEKAASARGVSAVESLLSHRMQNSVEDPDLLKVAMEYCPESPLEYYEKVLGGTVKVAEPPPPKGISAKTWDKILQKGPKTE